VTADATLTAIELARSDGKLEQFRVLKSE